MLKCNLILLAFKMFSKITLNHRVLDTLRLFSFSSFWNSAYFTLILLYKELQLSVIK